jgi:hypothetical protein
MLALKRVSNIHDSIHWELVIKKVTLLHIFYFKVNSCQDVQNLFA